MPDTSWSEDDFEAVHARVGNPSLRLRFDVADLLVLQMALLRYLLAFSPADDDRAPPPASTRDAAQYLLERIATRLGRLDPAFLQICPWLEEHGRLGQ